MMRRCASRRKGHEAEEHPQSQSGQDAWGGAAPDQVRKEGGMLPDDLLQVARNFAALASSSSGSSFRTYASFRIVASEGGWTSSRSILFK